VVAVHPTSLDTHGAGLTFHGAIGTLTRVVPRGRLQPFVFVKAIRGVTGTGGAVGNEIETTFGSEAEGSTPHGFQYQAMGNLQRGSYANRSIEAGSGFGRLLYNVPVHFLAPRLGGSYDYASGNPQTDPTRVRTYDQLYPSNHNAFGLLDLFGFQNLAQWRGQADLAPTRNLTLLIQGGGLSLADRRDNLYTSSGGTAIKAPAGGFASDAVGHTLDFSAKWVYRESLVANFGAGHLFPGAVLEANHKGAPQTIAYVSLTYRLHVSRDGE
jgi:hypothetical protein